MFVGEVGVMNRLRDKIHARVFNPEIFHESFKTAIVPHMTEAAGIEHVKRNRLRMQPMVFVENELSLRIDVALNHPRARNPIYSGLWSGNPSSPDVIFGILPSRFLSSDTIIVFQLSHCFFDSSPYWRPKEINFNYLL